MKPMFTVPLADLGSPCRRLEGFILSLPDGVLAADLEELRARCADPTHDLDVALMRLAYEREHDRRRDQSRAFDTELAALLDRLERHTSEADRTRLREIGRRIHAIGGDAAMEAAYARMMKLANPKRRKVRERIFGKFWAGIRAKAA